MAPPRKSRILCLCPVCLSPYEVLASRLAIGRSSTCSRPCSYRLRMQTRRPVGRKRRSPEQRRETKRQKDSRYRVKYRVERSKKQSLYIRAHPEIALFAQERRRARKLNAPRNDFTRAQWRTIKTAYQNRCVYCGETFERLTMDHVIPLSRGGSHTMSNIVPACKSCNCQKSTHHRVALLPRPSSLMDMIKV